MDKSDQALRERLISDHELVGSLAHDLKGLLSGLDGGFYLMDSGLSKGDEERINKGREMAKRNIVRIKRAVSHLLYYVKDRNMDWQSLDAESIVLSVRDILKPTAHHLKVRLSMKATAIDFEGDEFAVQSLLINLLEYALDACHLAGEVPLPSVSLKASEQEDAIIFHTLADGFLMPVDRCQRALDDLYSPIGGDRSHLKLFLARKLILQHRGSLQIEPLAEKKQTRFIVQIPRKQNR